MRYIKGDWKGRKPASILRAILQNLASLHELGWVHGDVRLANMLPTPPVVVFCLTLTFVGKRAGKGITRACRSYTRMASAMGT
jgi:tRNA A-37 threonylcarbamoyl transferase component Bud32